MKKILIISHNYIGDVLLTTPAIKFVREHYKKDFIAVIISEKAKEIIINNPYIDKLIIRKKFFDLLKTIKKYKFDLCVIFQDTLENAFLCWFAGIPKRIGYKKEGAQFFLTSSIKKNLEQHTIYSHIELANILVKNSSFKSNGQMQIFLNEEEEKKGKELFIEQNIKDEDLLIGLCPFTTREAKQWSLENFAKVADFVIQKYKAKVIITGTKNDILQADRILRLMKEKPINFVGKTTLSILAYTLKKCKLVITVDSASMHIASAVKNPVILSLFGSTNPKSLAPLEEKHITFYKNLKCSPCNKNKCKINECMKLITFEEIIEIIEVIIKK